MSQRFIGIVLVLLSAVIFSTAGIFTKGVTADAWAVLFWRGLSAAGAGLLYLIVTKKLKREAKAWDMPSFWIMLSFSIGTIFYFIAFKLTSVTNVVVIWATIPFFATFFAWLLLGEKPTLLMLICSGFALIGAVLAVGMPEFSSVFLGEALALGMNIVVALMMVAYRRWPETPSGFPPAVSSVLVLLFALWWTEPMSVKLDEIIILLIFGVLFAAGTMTMFEGAKRLSPVEVSLLTTIETPLAVLLAYVVLAEVITSQAMIGGVIVVLAVVAAQFRTA